MTALLSASADVAVPVNAPVNPVAITLPALKLPSTVSTFATEVFEFDTVNVPADTLCVRKTFESPALNCTIPTVSAPPAPGAKPSAFMINLSPKYFDSVNVCVSTYCFCSNSPSMVSLP